MIKIAFVLLFLIGCDKKIVEKSNTDKKSCFESGGHEFQNGWSGGYQHIVCVYKREIK